MPYVSRNDNAEELYAQFYDQHPQLSKVITKQEFVEDLYEAYKGEGTVEWPEELFPSNRDQTFIFEIVPQGTPSQVDKTWLDEFVPHPINFTTGEENYSLYIWGTTD